MTHTKLTQKLTLAMLTVITP